MGIVYVVTCSYCGRSWQRGHVEDGQELDCIFCGLRGQLVVGARPAGAVRRAEAWLVR